jgi:3-isopropylmalate/(R)-2-methylmalate dehydratase large subunit
MVRKIWDDHVVRDLGDGWDLLHIDRHLLHDLTGAAALNDLARRGLTVRNPDLCFATPDHAISTLPGRTAATSPVGARLHRGLKQATAASGIRMFDIGEGQGIVHVMAPELGLILPGFTIACGDSHTCTNGGMGALTFGIGTSECVHVLATQTLRQRRPKTMRITLDGNLGRGVTAKDVILHLIGRLGSSGANGHIVEFAGTVIRDMDIDGRLTLCNLTTEMGARGGLIAPDDRLFAYLKGRRFAPHGNDFDTAVAHWRTLASDEGAPFDRDLTIDVGDIAPTISWGTNPEQVIAIDQCIPDPQQESDVGRRAVQRDALAYMGLEGGGPLAGTPVQWVFIGSCANSRLSDLREAAAVVRDKRAAAHVTAWVVPGSEAVRQAAEAEGLNHIFIAAGFQWREPGCSLCVAANGDIVPPGARCVSTSNRNFVGRQGPGARTHLASPAMAAAAAIAGAIVDVRQV